MARQSSELVLSLEDHVTGPARGIDRSLDKLQNRNRSAMSLMRQQNRLTAESAVSMSRASTMALAGAARAFAPLAAAYGGGSVVREAADFESALTNIQKKAGIGADETKRLGEEIKELATSGQVAVPLEEIAAAYERGAAAGIPLDELRQFALLSAKAADAFEMSATDVGNAAAGFNKALGVPMKDMERLFDLVNGLADSGIADESGIVEFLDRAGAMAKTFGLTVNQTAALGAALANLKVPASQAATAMNSIMTKLLAPKSLSKKGFSAFKRLVGDTDAFAKKLSVDADGALVDLIGKLKTLDSASRTGVIADLFGQEHLDVMSQLVEGSDELVRNLKYAANETGWQDSLGKSYALKLDDFWSQWQILKNEMTKLAIDVGTAGMPALKASLEGVRGLVDQIGEGMDRFQNTLDTSEIDKAKQAIGELGEAMTKFLGIKTDSSPISSFGEEAAKEVNRLARTVNKLYEAVDHYQRANDDDPTNNPAKGTNFFSDLKEVVRTGLGRDELEERSKDKEPTGAIRKDERDDRASSRPLPDIDTDRFGGHNAPPATGPIPAPRPATIPIPTPRPSASDLLGRKPTPAMVPSAADAEIRAIDQQLGELVNKKTQLEQVFKLAPDPTAVTTMGLIADEMQRLIDRQNELSNTSPTLRIDTANIDQAQRKVNALASSMRDLQSLSGGVGRGIDTTGIHADTGRF